MKSFVAKGVHNVVMNTPDMHYHPVPVFCQLSTDNLPLTTTFEVKGIDNLARGVSEGAEQKYIMYRFSYHLTCALGSGRIWSRIFCANGWLDVTLIL